jgi:CheY-like chemotaxis protein
MPIMDGPTAAKSIRELDLLKVNIIGITGNVLPDDIKFFKACGANDVRAKPVKIVDLNMSWLRFFSSHPEDSSDFCGSSCTNCDIDL